MATGINRSWQYLVDPYVKASFPEQVNLSANQRLSIYVCPEYGKLGDGSSTNSNRPSSSYGANAYVLKSNFDQSNLLEIVGRLI